MPATSSTGVSASAPLTSSNGASAHAGSASSVHPDTGSAPTATPGESVFDRLEPLLPLVSKPIQYVGGELNSTVKPWESPAGAPVVRWCLMYPDAYEVGLPNQGVQILYEVLNERPEVIAPAIGLGKLAEAGIDLRVIEHRVRLVELPAVDVDLLVADQDRFAGKSDHALHVVLDVARVLPGRRVEHDDVAAVHVVQVVAQLVDEHTVTHLEGRHHRF